MQTPLRFSRAGNGTLWLAGLLLLSAGLLRAEPITYVYTTTATGTLAGTAFTNAPVVVISIADTSQVTVSGSSPFLDYMIIPLVSTIKIEGFQTASFIDQTFWEDPNGAGDIEFGVLGAFPRPILGLTRLFVGLETYDLKSSFGPLSSPFDFPTSAFNFFQNVATSEGSLSLVAHDDTFTAVTTSTPEPLSLLVALSGLIGLLVMRLLNPRCVPRLR